MAVKERVGKTYLYIPEMMSSILKMRLEDKNPLKSKAPIRQDDPRRVAARLAPKTPPPVAELLAKRGKSRFGEFEGPE